MVEYVRMYTILYARQIEIEQKTQMARGGKFSWMNYTTQIQKQRIEN